MIGKYSTTELSFEDSSIVSDNCISFPPFVLLTALVSSVPVIKYNGSSELMERGLFDSVHPSRQERDECLLLLGPGS